MPGRTKKPGFIPLMRGMARRNGQITPVPIFHGFPFLRVFLQKLPIDPGGLFQFATLDISLNHLTLHSISIHLGRPASPSAGGTT